MSTLSGQQGAGSKENPPGKSSTESSTGNVHDRYLGGSSSDGGHSGPPSHDDVTDGSAWDWNTSPFNNGPPREDEPANTISREQDSHAEKSSRETTKTSDPLKGLDSSDEGGGTRGTTAGEFAGEGPSATSGTQRSLAEGASHG
ncbi:uncharacterized protein Z520_02636 [Fonsecaea multimorphosa CBS 102226]|uniref:Uncharacterized protein n=1 Tax=Fonsecaea multimorphosa CBS 102226 TaxID=1442371 RepID=A0A0D2KWC0_9EURO|nr:uncharacterized protein Z520_02636 [Fonsecaea multimorphosa CBS 102226]KIY01084.1 hypothetical protein Z520_02636 [Fonsecaea multimorphosa CBS 102226]